MVKIAVVKSSTLTALGNTWLDAGHAIRIKDRLDRRGADETPDEVRYEHETMQDEARERMLRARLLRDQAREMEELARAEEEEAAILANDTRKNLSRRFGM